MNEIKTESDFFQLFFKLYLVLHGHREIIRVEHARLPDVQAVHVSDQRILQYEMKIGSFTVEPRVTRHPELYATYKVKFRPGQLAYAVKVNTYGDNTVRLAIYDRKKNEALICVPVNNGERTRVFDHIKL